MTYQQALDALLAVRRFLTDKGLIRDSYRKAFDNALLALSKKVLEEQTGGSA